MSIRVKLYDNRKRGKHVGIAVAVKVDGVIRIGWSVCNPKDRYNKELADRIANGRAMMESATAPPRFVQEQLSNFANRATKYFDNPNPKRLTAS